VTGVPAAPQLPGVARTVMLLLRAARRRAAGRQRRQRELLRNRAAKKAAVDWSGLSFAVVVIFMMAINIGAAFVVREAVSAGERLQAERGGKVVVNHWFLEDLRDYQRSTDDWTALNAASLHGETTMQWLRSPGADAALAADYAAEAAEISRDFGGTVAANEARLRDAVHAGGAADFIALHDAMPGFRALPVAGPMPAMLGNLVLFWWAVMLVFQGEGLELDLQRRRHPMWEWLFSHPVPARAIFLAEMLSPIAANPIYCGAPLFAGFLYGFVYGPWLGCLAACLVGIPITIAAASMGKALEIGVMLRLPPRSRGAMIGLMSWAGYAAMMLFVLGWTSAVKISTAIGGMLAPLGAMPRPWLGWLLGAAPDGGFSFLWGVALCWAAAGFVTALAMWVTVWAARKGLAAPADAAPARARKVAAGFGREPLYAKEWLWLVRDRSAIVQVILVPLTMASFQLFNMRGLLAQAQNSWNYLCGAGILFGTYILWVLGPRSLASEGPALWITLTWPRGLESLLKAKAWLWTLISTGIVAIVLVYAGFLYPGNIWEIALLGIGWWFFGRSMAEKSVTLVTVSSASGETEKISAGRRWAASLGTFTFAIGALTQQWHIAFMGIVYSHITAAAMWQNFRARMPYLYDPWSETLPPAPTLMHAMIAISILVDVGAILTALALAFAGRGDIAVAQVVIYGLCAGCVSMGVWWFLDERGVPARDVWFWGRPRDGEAMFGAGFFVALGIGLGCGVALGLVGLGYETVLHHIPYTAGLLRQAQKQMTKIPELFAGYRICAIAIAPFAEEFLFRGLLFRELDPEWGGWRAVLGSAVFFVVFHPVLAWVRVGLLGVTNARLFKRTGRLAPCVVAHMAYNVLVLGWV